MTMAHTNHLSEAALSDVLIGLCSPDSEAHLAVCPACRSRVQEFQSTVQAFNAASTAWSEARPPFPLPSPVPVIRKPRPAYAAPLGWALAAAILVAIGLPVWNTHSRPAEKDAPSPVALAIATSTDSEAQIAQDNELLRSVNLALSSDEEYPVSEYDLLDSPHTRARSRAELRNQ